MRPRSSRTEKRGRPAGGAAPRLAPFARVHAEVDPLDYISTTPGRIPVVITAPHGGNKLIPGVAVRENRGQMFFETIRDLRTAELAERLAAYLATLLGGPPYLVIARFDRQQIDANRPSADAYTAPGNDGPKVIYDAYHAELAASTAEIERIWGAGVLLDIHGQALLPGRFIRGTRNGETVKSLVARRGVAALNGPKSLFGALAELGYPITPSSDAGNRKELHFTGGHNVDTHGSGEGGHVDAIQIEIGSRFRTVERLDRTARDLAAATAVFAKDYLPQKPK